MCTQASEVICAPAIDFNLALQERRKSIFEFMIRQLEIIEEQTYLMKQEAAGIKIFQAIQLLENIGRPPEGMVEEEEEDNE